MARPKLTSSRSTPRPSTRSQQHSPPRSKPSVVINVKNPSTAASSSRGETSDNDNDSVCSSRSSDVVLSRSSTAKGKGKDDSGAVKAPWRHPDELDYFRPHDWSEDRIISQLRSLVYAVGPPVHGKQPFIEVTPYDGGDFDKPKQIKVPRGYRVPLMFVAKFQWASLKLVLTSAQREEEWSYYKFDILHLSRLCERFFAEATAACNKGIIDIPPTKARAPEFQFDPGAMTRKWRCATFDRALARYNKNWLISREEFLRDFYREFEDEEYAKDVLKIDWSRWALKGHKGFKLTQEELRCGIDGRMITRGLKKDDDGKWVWVDEYVIKQEEVAVAVESIQKSETPIQDSRDVPTAISPSPATPQIVSPDSETLAANANGRISHTPSQPKEPELSLIVGQPVNEPSLPSEHSQTPGEKSNPIEAQQVNPDDSIRSTSSEQIVEDQCHSPLSSAPVSVPQTPLDSEPQTETPFALPLPSPALPAQDANSDPNLHYPPERPASSPLIIPSIVVPSRLTPSSGRNSPSASPAQDEHLSKMDSPVIPSVAIGLASVEAHDPESSTDVVTGDTSQDSIYKNGLTDHTANTLIDQKEFSPTSIDSTPTPSPTIALMALRESFSPLTPGPNTFFGGPHIATTALPPESATLDLDPRSPTSTSPLPSIPPIASSKTQDPDTVLIVPTDSPLSTPTHWPASQPKSPLEIYDNAEAIESNEFDNDTKLSTGPHSPIFLSPLLPPPKSRSGSPDEIPGLGGLSTRGPFAILPQSIFPPLKTADWLREDFSLSYPRSSPRSSSPDSMDAQDTVNEGDGTRSDQLTSQLDKALGTPPLELNTATAYESPTEPEFDSQPSSPTDSKSEPELLRERTPAFERNPMIVPVMSPNQSHNQGDDYDDDSDMDFGTPVTSPVIIVPELKLGAVDMLPPPISSTPPSVSRLKDAATKTQALAPWAAAKVATPRATTPKAASSNPTTFNNDVHLAINGDKTRPESPASMLASSAQQGEREEIKNLRLYDERDSTSTGAASLLGSSARALQLSMQPPGFAALIPAPPSPTASPPGLTRGTVVSSLSAPVPPLPTHADRAPTGASLSSPALRMPSALGSESPAVPPVAHVQPPIIELGSFNLLPPPQSTPLQHHPTPHYSQWAIQTSLPLSAPQTDRPQDQLSPASFQESRFPATSRPNSLGSLESTFSNFQQTSRKRQREDDSDGEEQIRIKSRKSREGLTAKEGGVVVRKVVSMVRDTLSGLNDLLELAAEKDFIPFEKLQEKGKAKENAEVSSEEDSVIHTPTSPISRTQSQMVVEQSEVAQLHEELRTVKAEMAKLREQKAREAPVGPDVRAMRMELEALREQVRALKEAEATASDVSEVRTMRDEIVSLKNEMRSLQSNSRRSSFGPSTPSTPNLSFRFHSHAVHPLAHLLAVESDTVPPTPMSTGTGVEPHKHPEASQRELEASQMTHCGARLPQLEATSTQAGELATSPHNTAVFDDIPLPVKSKRKARMIFSRS